MAPHVLPRRLLFGLFGVLLAGCGTTSDSVRVPSTFVAPTTKAIDGLAVGEIAETCAFVIASDNRLLLYHTGSPILHGSCIKVRRDKDGFVAIIEKSMKGTWEAHDSIWMLCPCKPVVRIEWV